MVNGKKVVKGMFSPAYVDLLLPHAKCKNQAVTGCLRRYLINGGAMAKYANEEVGRDAIFRAVKRFEALHNMVGSASAMLPQGEVIAKAG